jgi:two-component system, chemotaxis family, chemotaxis protein CheY
MKILVTDDSKMIRHLVISALNELGYNEIIEAANVGEAKNLLKGHKVGLIISDWHMPGDSGLDFLKYIKASAEYATIPFVLQTTENEKKNIVEAVKAGVQGYLFKPVQKSALLQKLLELSKAYNFQPPLSDKQAIKEISAKSNYSCMSGHSINDFVTELSKEGESFSFSVRCETGVSSSVTCGIKALRQFPKELRQRFPENNIVLICDSDVKTSQKELISQCENELHCSTFTIDNIEHNRTLSKCGAIVDEMASKNIEASSVMVAIGDEPLLSVAGFVASTYMGGLPFVIVPLSLPAYLNSNAEAQWRLHDAKDRPIAFSYYDPAAIWFDIDPFIAIPDADYVFACAELFRYAFIGGEEMAKAILKQWNSILKKDTMVISEILRLCCAVRVSIGTLKSGQLTKMTTLQFAQPLAEALLQADSKKQLNAGKALYRAISCMCEAGNRAKTITAQSTPVYIELLKLMPIFQLTKAFNSLSVFRSAFKSEIVGQKSPAIALPWNAGSVVIRDDIDETEYSEAFKPLLCPPTENADK